MNSALLSSNSNEWYTPHYLFDYLNNLYNFTLDPCATKESAKCSKYYTKVENGLIQNWSNEKVFINPPYGRDIKDWVIKALNESKYNNAECVMLIPARTDTSYWQDYIFPYAKKIYFIRGRIKFEMLLTQEIYNKEIFRVWGTKQKPKYNKKDINKIILGASAPFPSAVIVFSNHLENKIINTFELDKCTVN